MNQADLQARRAILDDLPSLRDLWSAAGVDPGLMEKQLRDIQVIVDAGGRLVGAAAFQIQSSQAWLHDETYASEAVAAAARPLLIERIRVIARNHGLHRVWTLSGAPFWSEQGFMRADAALVQKLPAAFGAAGESWEVLKLREETPESVSLDHELALFVQAQKASSEQWRRQAQWIKNGAYILLTIMILLGTILTALSLFPSARWRSYLRGSRPVEPAGTALTETNRPPPTADPAR